MTTEHVEIEIRACFINCDTGDVVELLDADKVENANLFGVYTGKPGDFTWCADFLELDHAELFVSALNNHLINTEGLDVICHNLR